MSEASGERSAADELLAQQKWPADADYADYRRRLDQALEEAARSPRRLRAWPSRRALLALAIPVAACVLLAVFLQQGPPEEAEPDPRNEVVVLRWEGSHAAFPEDAADVVAVATMGEAVAGEPENVLGLKISRVLKGTLAAASTSSPRETPSFCCCLPSAPAPVPLFCREGARVVVFLKRSPAAGWKLVDIQELTGESEARLERDLGLHGKGKRQKVHLAW